MTNFITHNVSRLATFSGRETRAQFWPYVGTVFLLQMAGSFVVMAVQMRPFMAKAQAFVLAHPELSSGTQDPSQYSESVKAESLEMFGSFGDMFGATALANGIMVAIVVALYAAAVARRLHDRGMRGWWGLMPIPFLAFGLAIMPKLMNSFGSAKPDLSLFGLMFINNMIYFATLVTLIVLLARRSDPGINRYGPPPALQA